MTARDLQVGDVVRLPGSRMEWTISDIEGSVCNLLEKWGATYKWDSLRVPVKSVHRPQPDGSLLQVFPGVEAE